MFIEHKLRALGRNLNHGIMEFMSLQIWLLMFADDLVLISKDIGTLATLFGFVQQFCVDNELHIS